MKVSIVVQDLNFLGGAERVAVNLANYLANNHFVSIVSFITIDERKMTFDISPNIKLVSLYCKGINFHKNIFDKLLFKYKNWKLLKNYLIADNVDIVICNNIFPNICTFNKIDSVKIIEIQHLCYEETALENLKWERQFFSIDKIWFLFQHKKYIFLRNKIYKKLKHVIVLTKREEEKFLNSGVKNVVFIPNAINLCNNSTSFNYFREKNIISVGRLKYQKGFDRLVKLISPVLKNNQDWTLTIYGAGPDKEELIKLIQELGVQDSILLMDSTKNIMEKFLKSEIYLMTSRYEGFGMVLLEALSCGLPIISFDINSGPNEIITNQEDGFLIEDGDEAEFRLKVSELMADNELRLNMRLSAYTNVKRYSWQKIGIQWDNLLKSFNNS